MSAAVKRITLLLFMLLPVSAATQAEADIHHLVFVWLNAGAAAQQLDATIEASQALAAIPGVHNFKVAKAIASDRAVVDDSFSFAITMTFASSIDMQRYLVSDVHQSYLRDHIKGKASKVVVHDF